MPAPAVILENVGFTYPGAETPALEGVSLRVEVGVQSRPDEDCPQGDEAHPDGEHPAMLPDVLADDVQGDAGHRSPSLVLSVRKVRARAMKIAFSGIAAK